MQTFRDTETGEFWEFDSDVLVESEGGVYKFVAPFGGVLDTPSTLVQSSRSPSVEVKYVPASVSRYQGREAMRLTPFTKQGEADWTLFDAFEELLNDPSTPAYYRRAWDELQAFERESAMLNAAAEVLGLTQAKLDDLFRLAAALKA
ncbi:hypothetical protein LMG26696_02633 [Achromobacter pulmonis]|uniref:hypothetical protein n=1 Tax=Achromobacter pulmonis TaxID=1389932 RepID=UPI0014652CA5|nr:hypothetical protein [Achromobacter pulmonis]CAB3647766.1 hypothetical protein LMG26696_02633 [Achromobacter pulmonis]